MDVEELRSELGRRALIGQGGATPVEARVAGAKRMARTRRNARTAGAAVAAVAVVLLGFGAAAALGPARHPEPATRPSPAVKLSADVDRWPHTWGGLERGSSFGGGGAGGSMSIRPLDTDMAVVGSCRPEASVFRPGSKAEISVNGHVLLTVPCVPDGARPQVVTPFRFSADPGTNREAWQRLGLRPGRTNMLRAHYVDAAGRPITGTPHQLKPVTIGAGTFDGPVRTAGADPFLRGSDLLARLGLQEQVPVDFAQAGGGTFALKHAAAVTLTRTHRTVTLTVPAGTQPLRVRWGVDMQHLSKGTLMRLTVDGREVKTLPDGGIDDLVTLDGSKPHTLRAEADPGMAGIVLLSVYGLGG